MSDFVKGPAESYPKPPSSYKGGSGSYDGDGNGSGNLPTRTPSPNAVPEKFYDKPEGD
jgi:hypothetical protein